MKMTKEEMNIILPVVMRLLREKSTPSNQLYGKRIVDWLNYKQEQIGFTSAMSEIRLRKCINYIRTNGLLPVIADDNGYYVTNDPIVIREMAESLRRRVASINAAASGLDSLADAIDPPKKQQDPIEKYVKNHRYVGRNEDAPGEYIYVGLSERDLH